MEDFLKHARKQLDDLDVQGQLKDLDLGKLKDVDLKRGRKELKKQMRHFDMQKREQDAANEGFVGGVLLGIVVGAILALIFAPRTGSETREMVADTASELKHKAEGLVGQSREETEETVASTLNDEPAIEREIGEANTPPAPGDV